MFFSVHQLREYYLLRWEKKKLPIFSSPISKIDVKT